MFCIIYAFDVRPGMEEDFMKGWEGLTRLIYQYEGSLGSRIHHETEERLIAYAQWPDEFVFEESGKKLPEEADVYRQLMRQACVSINTLHRLHMLNDLTQTKPYSH